MNRTGFHASSPILGGKPSRLWMFVCVRGQMWLIYGKLRQQIAVASGIINDCVSALHWTHTYCIYKATPYVSYTILLGEWHADDVRRRLLCCDFVIAHILANEQRPSKHIICVYCTIVGHICIIYATHALGRANQHTHTLPSTTKDAQNRAWWSLRSPFFRVRAVETDLGAGPV